MAQEFSDKDNVASETLAHHGHISTSSRIGHRNLVANCTRDTGHAWGLYHEHQNPAWWPEYYTEESVADDRPEGKVPFFGKADQPFGDAQWDTTRREPDWASVMIYPSFPGNADGGAGKDMAALLTKPNGDLMKPVTKLRHLDVEGLKRMYSVSQLPLGEASCR
ncbi:hypothetical protein ACKVWM_001459 [Pyricularia oryzae]